MFSLIYAWINNWVNNGEAGDVRRRRTHYDANVMVLRCYNDSICGRLLSGYRKPQSKFEIFKENI